MADASTLFLKRGQPDGPNHLSKVRQAHHPSGIPGLGDHRGHMLLSSGSARPSRGKEANNLRKLRKCVANLKATVRPSGADSGLPAGVSALVFVVMPPAAQSSAGQAARAVLSLYPLPPVSLRSGPCCPGGTTRFNVGLWAPVPLRACLLRCSARRAPRFQPSASDQDVRFLHPDLSGLILSD